MTAPQESELNETEANELFDIGLRMALGAEVSHQDQLRFLRSREADLSAKFIAGDDSQFGALESIRAQIDRINQQIMDSGGTGGGTTGQGSLRDSGNNPR